MRRVLNDKNVQPCDSWQEKAPDPCGFNYRLELMYSQPRSRDIHLAQHKFLPYCPSQTTSAHCFPILSHCMVQKLKHNILMTVSVFPFACLNEVHACTKGSNLQKKLTQP